MTNDHPRIAALLTCYNRKPTTLRCLGTLHSQSALADIDLATYLVDDGSSDGTGQAVREQFPSVQVLQGTGGLYWGGGMRLAWSEAMKRDYDYYLWLNDDAVLLPNALGALVAASRDILANTRKECVMVGSCRDPETGRLTYGGALWKTPEAPLGPRDVPLPCEIINGNVVLVSRGVFKAIGGISPEFSHVGGDNDYGLRAIKAGFPVFIAPGYQALCARNNKTPWNDPAVPLRERWRSMHSPKGQPPYETYVFARRHSGPFWIKDLVKLYFRVLFPGLHLALKRLQGRQCS